ncbi:DNA-directed RNA polymerase sigma-70 factor [Actinomycetospora sp. NBRC 106375]|uniref:RNA polymerase subunit sigma-70 n=1 Tax=Actinomycetospora sp. NBRC 106375 TaxID=3032207 RepID=UPI0024A5C0AA|nr:RNA polymerase subunit sigma-70 [Actinomycetospora sp. NBRC 106375]GLZ46077.1 DNA-directed RNA polymerase sigma-70 factor [Actinomycetospora sp. NBRC 106375]
MAAPTVDELEALRVPLTAHCYRMLGSAADTDDAVQEAIVRAFRHRERYDPDRGALPAWVYRIATTVCLDLLRAARRRALCVDLGPAAVPGADLGLPLPADRFVEPMPDARLVAPADPAEVTAQRETVRLAFVAALQHLPPRQRATLLLRDVLAFSAAETAEVLGTTTAAVTSALQRARETLERHRPAPGDLLDETDPEQRRLLARYVDAFEAHDVARLTDLLREDARTSMPPHRWWIEGGATIAGLVGLGGCAGARLAPVAISGQPGFGQYRPDESGVLRPFALVLVETRGDRVAHMTTFLGTADRFAAFGLPAVLGPGFLRATDESGAART